MKTYLLLLLVTLISFVSSETPEVPSSGKVSGCTSTSSSVNECRVGGKTTSCLDMAIELIKTVRDNTSSCVKTSYPTDCEDVLRSGKIKSGVYTIWPKSRVSAGRPLDVYCDMENDGGGWTVIQRRGNFNRPADFFFKGWKAYKEGFGDIQKDFWLGNDNIFALTNQKLCSIRFSLSDFDGYHRYALYDTFWIEDESRYYMSHIAGYSGNAGDSMLPKHNGNEFTTIDRRRSGEPSNSCANRYKGGWWYDTPVSCHSANLNGMYHKGKYDGLAEGIDWSTWRGYHYSLKETEIKIRSKDYRR